MENFVYIYALEFPFGNYDTLENQRIQIVGSNGIFRTQENIQKVISWHGYVLC